MPSNLKRPIVRELIFIGNGVQIESRFKGAKTTDPEYLDQENLDSENLDSG